MVKIFYLIVTAILLFVQAIEAIEYNTTISNQQRCETCKDLLSLGNVDLNDIETYDGFEGFLIRYDAIQQYGIQDPEVICLLTDMCPLYGTEQHLQTELSVFDELYYDNDLIIEEGLNEVVFKMKLKNPVCSACKKIFKWVQQQVQHLANKRPNKGVVRGFVARGCDHIPRWLRKSCRVLIKRKIGKLVKTVMEHYAPELACQMAKACF